MQPLTRTICALFCLLLTLPLTFGSPFELEPRRNKLKIGTRIKQRRPTYAIAHMVLDKTGVKDAIKHGANALEIDVAAYRGGWWADHDMKAKSKGWSLESLFQVIAKENKHIAFVWLDLKTPDMCTGKKCNKKVLQPSKCKENEKCSMKSLQQLTRKYLKPAGVRVLFGFYKKHHARSAAFDYIQKSLGDGEAVCLSGEANKVMEIFKKEGSKIKPQRRVMDYGRTELPNGFGDCNEKGGKTCAELKNGAKLRQKGDLQRVFAWTSHVGEGKYVNKLLDKASVDGIIYGFAKTRYYHHKDTEKSSKDIIDRVKKSKSRYMVTGADKLW
ncbi:hypothetical protein PABG_02293 [Paracoccidioides brasiliensis Pb03]|uniref:Sphingomyelinase D n=1 Tax=Paracoccidioides brasiliensis (strain Pb03) TaxID=482561 RepID=SMD_PARBP|nr:RecName: Full=Sphingomyelinase D; Short=SMase D; Flags: Precursor [Paracoccidioides brasiliensis Pb03]EEH20034.1 hypothetical protein PABG_02293 [Paracoccidioides brasiliensis Pb03]